MLTRSAGMRMVFKSIVLSLAAMANVSIVLIIFFFIFAILGTQLFMGLLARCGKVWGEVWMYSVGSQGHPGHVFMGLLASEVCGGSADKWWECRCVQRGFYGPVVAVG